jgi:hypothetical protein
MKIDVLYISECPNHAPVVGWIRQILREYQLPEEITEIEVTDRAQAIELSFPGSPTVRINGEDVEPDFPKVTSHGLTCRTYVVGEKRQGVPDREWIRNAIAKAYRCDTLGS